MSLISCFRGFSFVHQEDDPSLWSKEEEALLLKEISQSFSREAEREKENCPRKPVFLFEKKDLKNTFLVKGGGLNIDLVCSLREEEKEEEECKALSLLALSFDASFRNLTEEQFIAFVPPLSLRSSFSFQSLAVKQYVKYQELYLTRNIAKINQIYEEEDENPSPVTSTSQVLALKGNNTPTSLLNLSWTICLKKFSKKKLARILFSFDSPVSLINQYSRRNTKEIQKHMRKIHPKRIEEKLLSQFPSLLIKKTQNLVLSKNAPQIPHTVFFSGINDLIQRVLSFFESLFPIVFIKKEQYISCLETLKEDLVVYYSSSLSPYIFSFFPLSKQSKTKFLNALDLLQLINSILKLCINAQIFFCQNLSFQSNHLTKKYEHTMNRLSRKLKSCQKMEMILDKLKNLTDKNQFQKLNLLRIDFESFMCTFINILSR